MIQCRWDSNPGPLDPNSITLSTEPPGLPSRCQIFANNIDPDVYLITTNSMDSDQMAFSPNSPVLVNGIAQNWKLEESIQDKL